MASHPRLGEYSGISASYELFHLFFWELT
jgi:hypothetical protein